MPHATLNSVEVTYLPILTPADMTAALHTAYEFGCAGTINAGRDPEGVERWMLALSSPTQPHGVNAAIGDVCVWMGTTVEVMSAAVFAERYTPKDE